MINKIRTIYPGFLILIKKDEKLYDVNNNLIHEDILKNNDYIIIIDDSYEVHKKIRP